MNKSREQFIEEALDAIPALVYPFYGELGFKTQLVNDEVVHFNARIDAVDDPSAVHRGKLADLMDVLVNQYPDHLVTLTEETWNGFIVEKTLGKLPIVNTNVLVIVFRIPHNG